jgi:chaperonin GroES
MRMATATKAKTLKIQPLEDRVVIVPSEEAEAMRGGLYIPDTAKEKPTQGEVIAVGPGRIEKGQRVPVDLKVGDNVIYGKYSGTPFQMGEDEVIIIKASDVLAKIS